MIKKYAQGFLIAIHLLLIIAINIKGTISSYYEFYTDTNAYQKRPSYIFINRIINFKPIYIYMTYSGFNTNYGFFAPNVASEFIATFTVKDSLGGVIERRLLPTLENKESVERFTVVLHFFLEKLCKRAEDKSLQLDNYVKVILKTISLNIKKEYPTAKTIESRVFLYNYPTMEEFQQENKPNYLLSEFAIY